MRERRKFRRIPFAAPATAFTGNEHLECQLEDLSASGVAFRVDRDCETGRFVRLQFSASPELVLDVDAVVVRCARGTNGTVWGAAFVGLDDSKTQELLRVLAAHLRRTTTPPPSLRARQAATATDQALRSLYRAALREVASAGNRRAG